MRIVTYFQVILFINIFNLIISLRFPINHDLDNSTGQIELIEIETSKSYINYTKYNKVISLFYGNYCKYCKYLYEVFKWSSTYSNVSDWKFLAVNCTKRQLVCNNLNTINFPIIKTHINKTELPYNAPFELIPLLEYLIKLSSPSFIEINNLNISKFYSEYGYFSPIVEYYQEKNNFYNCIETLSENEYKTIFYFGMKKILNSSGSNSNQIKEKINIDNNGFPFTYIWEGNCSKVDSFLKEHIYPLITIVEDSGFFYELNKSKKILIMLFGCLSNNKTKNFMNQNYKNLAYVNNKNNYIFSFLNYSNTRNINLYFGIKLYADSELKIIIFDFNIKKYYNHPIIYDVNYNSPEEIISDFSFILNNLSKLDFITGHFLNDLLNKYGIKEIDTKFCLIFVIIVLGLTVSITLGCTFFCKKICPSEIEDNNFNNFDTNNNKEHNNIKMVNSKIKTD